MRKRKKAIVIVVIVVVLGMVASMVVYGFFTPGAKEEKPESTTPDLDQLIEESIRRYGPFAIEILDLEEALKTLEPGTEQYIQVESRIQELTNQIPGQFLGLAVTVDENGDVHFVDQESFEQTLRSLATDYNNRYGR